MAKKTSKAPTNSKSGKGKTPKKSTTGKVGDGAPFNEQDPKRRLGNFGGAGEHPRQGGRASGLVGQTKQRNKTDKSSGKKK